MSWIDTGKLRWTDAAALIPGVGTNIAIAGRLNKDEILDDVMPERKAAREMKKSGEAFGKMQDDLTAWFDDANNRDFFDTTMGQTFKNLLTQKTQEQNQQLDMSAAITGATNEAKIAGKSGIAEGFGKSLAGLSQYGTAWKDNQYSNYFSRLMGLENSKMGANVGAANQEAAGQARLVNNVQGMMDNASGTASSLAPLLAAGSDRKFKKNIKKVDEKKGINIYTFEYDTDKYPQFDEGIHTGVIAQEVEGVIPNSVIEKPDGKYVNYTVVNEYLN